MEKIELRHGPLFPACPTLAFPHWAEPPLPASPSLAPPLPHIIQHLREENEALKRELDKLKTSVISCKSLIVNIIIYITYKVILKVGLMVYKFTLLKTLIFTLFCSLE